MTPTQKYAFHRKVERIHATPPTVVRKDLPCPLCGRFLRLRDFPFGRYYRCTQKGCTGKIGARDDGSPRLGKVKPKTCWQLLLENE